ncbi:MAG: hypothetical protein ACI8RD_013112 [Bacillariaceae sp.]|jgi:hypothetical protein
MHQYRYYDCIEKRSFQTTTMNLLILSTLFFLDNVHNFPYNHYAGAFVIRKCNIVKRQWREQETTKSDRHNIFGACRAGRNRIINSHTNSRIKTLSLGTTILFDSLITEQEKELILTRDQVDSGLGNIITSTVTNDTTATASETKSSNSRIEVVMPNNETSVVSLTQDAITASNNDTPLPTANGGFSHTTTSRAKISAANKGKVPWNKGKPRSEEVKARIAAGVRAKNRERFLKKVADMGLTEEEYEAQKREKRRIRDEDRRARRTANGGYRPTEETKKKISQILKEKHAKGEVKPRSKIDPSKVRKGFTHSEETRKKISESLRKRWRDDEGFRTSMKKSYSSREDVRKRISLSLKKKWQDPEFRNAMMEKMSERKSGKDAMNYNKSHRKKISDAMKLKWQDASYREKTTSSIQKAVRSRKATTSTGKLKSQNASAASESKNENDTSVIQKLQVNGTRKLQMIEPLTAIDITKRKSKKAPRKRAVTARVTDKEKEDVKAMAPTGKRKSNPNKVKGSGAVSSSTSVSLNSEDEAPIEKEGKKKKKKEKDGSVNRLREERRDLFDLLYGDEDINDDIDGDEGNMLSESLSTRERMLIGDEDLDAFDPYGLDDY